MTAQANITLRVEIFTKLIFAAAECAATKDIRNYLNAVCIEFRRNQCFVIGTDGQMVGVFKQYAEIPDMTILIPHDVIKRINKKAEYVVLKITGDECVIDGIEFKQVDGKYPDWRRVISSPDTTQEQVMVDPDLFARGAKAIKHAFGSKRMPNTVSSQAGEAVIMHVGDTNGFVLIMGIRKNHRPAYQPMVL